MKKWLTLLLVATASLSAAVEDQAGLFSAKGVASANEQLGKIRSTTGKEILFLTVNDLGGQKISEFGASEGRKRQLNGVLVIISKNPRHLEVMAGRKTTLVFKKENRDKVVEILSKNLRKTPDAALASAVSYIAETFRSANSILMQPDGQQRPQAMPVERESGSFGWLKWLLIIGVVILVIRLISYFMSRNAGAGAVPGSPGSPSGFGGGGFFSSLLGGIFGAVAGNWIYDKFFGDNHHDHSYYNQDSYRDSGNDWRNDDRGDFDSGSGSSGDWGGDSGSGDSGGDSGGSDW